MGDSSSSDGEGWLGAIEGGVFEEGEDERNRLEAAAAFVEKRREKGWRLTHDELYDGGGEGRIDTCHGPIVYRHAPGQQHRAWDCSLVLVRYLEKRPEEVRGRRVLELGCGIGLPGIASVIMGAREAILTDMRLSQPLIAL
ncbi:unnamed protein product [Discosporangium mesarthrocarpum]